MSETEGKIRGSGTVVTHINLSLLRRFNLTESILSWNIST
jgi:hypothetical protein